MNKKSGDIVSRPAALRLWRLLFLHPVRLISALLAEHARPRSLGAAGAFGALIGTIPILGLHTVLVYLGAQRLRLNRVVALGTSQLGLPPVIPALCIEVGYYLRHGELLTEISMRTLGREAPQRFWDWMIGALVVGPILAIIVGVSIWLLAVLVQRRSPSAAVVTDASDRDLVKENGEVTTAGQP